MKKFGILIAVSALAFVPATFLAGPTVYPTGTTIYMPEKCWSGYTIYQTEASPGAVLIDMIRPRGRPGRITISLGKERRSATTCQG